MHHSIAQSSGVWWSLWRGCSIQPACPYPSIRNDIVKPQVIYTCSLGRGALQDIDQMSLFKPLCKFVATVKRVADIVPTLKRAMQEAQSGTPGPVFVEFPIDTLYKYSIVEKEVASGGGGGGGGGGKTSKSLTQFFVDLYLRYYLHSLFAGAWDRFDPAPLNVRQPMSSLTNINLIVDVLNKAKKPVRAQMQSNGAFLRLQILNIISPESAPARLNI